MTTRDKAIEYMKTPEEAKVIAVRRLKGEDTTPLGNRWEDERPVDALIPLLSADSPAEFREAIIYACKKVHSEIIAWLSDPDRSVSSPRRKWLGNFCAVVGLSVPDELRLQTRALLEIALDNRKKDFELAYKILSAFRSYGAREDDLPIVNILIEEERFAAAAFTMLIQLNPRAPRVEKHLFSLWCKRHIEKWKVEVTFLAVRLGEQLGEDKTNESSPIVGALKRIYKEKREIYPMVEKELNELAERIGKDYPHQWLRLAVDENVGWKVFDSKVIIGTHLSAFFSSRGLKSVLAIYGVEDEQLQQVISMRRQCPISAPCWKSSISPIGDFKRNTHQSTAEKSLYMEKDARYFKNENNNKLNIEPDVISNLDFAVAG